MEHDSPPSHTDESANQLLSSTSTSGDATGDLASTPWWPWLHPNLIAKPGIAHAVPRSHALFARGATLRKMVVMVDGDLLNRDGRDDATTYLFRLVRSQHIELHYFADPQDGGDASACWVGVRPGAGENQRIVTFYRDGKEHHKLASTDWSTYRRVVEATDLPAAGAFRDPPTGMETDANAMLAARAAHVDLFVTERQLPLQLGHDPWSRATVMKPGDAIPLVGLYLRTQGKFIVGASTDNAGHGYPVRSEFYGRAAEALLPDALWWRTAFAASQAGTRGELEPLLAALLWRIGQVLRSRDRLFAALSAPPPDVDAMEDALSDLDQILLWLMASFDITAQVAHHALGMRPDKSQYAGWQYKKEWLKEVGKKDADLADLVRNGSAGEHVLTIVKELRNTIHGRTLSGDGKIPIVGGRAFETLARLPQRSRAEVLPALNKLGGLTSWGVGAPFEGDDLYLHPGDFVECLLPRALTVLRDLMRATPVEGLVGSETELAQQARVPPLTPVEERTLLQLGLESA